MTPTPDVIGTWGIGTTVWTATHTAEPHDASAVFLVAFDGDCVLAVRNERGWDLPGGHVEAGESLLAALGRETAEEAAATFDRAMPFAAIASSEVTAPMVFYVGLGISLQPFTLTSDALERRMMPPTELIGLYHGDRRVLAALLDAARKQLNSK